MEGEQTLNQIASKYDVLSKSLQEWKKQFFENGALAFEPAKAVKEYKEQIKVQEIEELQKALGKTIPQNPVLTFGGSIEPLKKLS